MYTSMIRRTHLGKIIITVCMAAATYAAMPEAAFADLKVCNKTGSRVGIAIGYKTSDKWTSEGWWNLKPDSCQNILKGSLNGRFYYVHAVDYDQGGAWSGKAFLCTRDKLFTADGTGECVKRGFRRTGFFEVDTGSETDWTVNLTGSNDKASTQ